MIDVLAITNLYPNPLQPRHGVFTEHRLRALAARPEVGRLAVVAPIAAFPLPGLSIGPYARLAAVPARAERHGIEVRHPRYVNIPAVGMGVQPDLMARALVPAVGRLIADGFDPDIIDAYYLYPDGVAAAAVARRFGKPLVLTAYGTDVTGIAAASPRAARRIREAAAQAGACTAVCAALRDALTEIGVEPAKLRVVLHGVDLALFRPAEDRAGLRTRLGLAGPTLFTAGNLIPLKGMDLAISALPGLPGATLAVAGNGPEEAALKALARRLGVADRVRFLGLLPQERLGDWYAAADAFVLMSEREGIPNVVMESLACGTPVLATAVWGVPEIVDRPEAGRLVRERGAAALAREAAALLADPPDRAATRRYAEGFTWEATARAHLDAFAAALGRPLE